MTITEEVIDFLYIDLHGCPIIVYDLINFFINIIELPCCEKLGMFTCCRCKADKVKSPPPLPSVRTSKIHCVEHKLKIQTSVECVAVP